VNDRQPLRLLCVDDDPEVLDVTRRVLAGDDRIEAEAVADPEAAVAALDDGAYDGVVSDSLRLPDGEPFAEAARRVAPGTAVVLFTAKEWDEVAETARAVDAAAVVRKGAPASFETLRAHLGVLATGVVADADADAGDADTDTDADADDVDGVRAAAAAEESPLPGGDLAGSVVGFDPGDDWEHVATHDLSGEEELVVTLAGVLDELVAGDERFEPLYYRLDAESLESFLRASGDDVRVTFAFLDWEFAVAGDGSIAARPRRSR
jgi:DNA-binding NarL/FixJ family response regulator